MNDLLKRERGSATPIVIASIALIILLTFFIADVGMFLLSVHRAQDAADASALAAVQESFPLFSKGIGPNDAAKFYAEKNGAMLENLEILNGGAKVEVSVSFVSGSFFLKKIGACPEKVTAKAAAEVDIDSLIASNEIWFTDPSKISEIIRMIGPTKDRSMASTMVVLLALEHLGEPYVWGAEGPNRFDCSGLVCYVYAQIGILLPRVTFDQVRVGKPVSGDSLEPGDLVFFRKNAHVGIYIGSGYFIHAPHTGDVVKISPLSARRDLSACRRILF